jgi:hypothetical protein
MQHYRVPARLLDWSKGALIALHLALSSSDNTDAAVWVLDAWWLNRLVLRRSGILRAVHSPARRYLIKELLPDPHDDRTKWIRRYLPLTYSGRALLRLPAAIQPPHIDRRIVAQLSAFTIQALHWDTVKTIDKRAIQAAQAARCDAAGMRGRAPDGPETIIERSDR